MDFEEYQRAGRGLYQRFAAVVHDLLDQAISEAQGYRLQQIQYRAKSVESLRARLQEGDQTDTNDIAAVRKDLAGCRLVFYTNNDVNRFATSGLLTDLFDIDWDRSKFHQPKFGEQEQGSLFQSNNYVVALKAERTQLIEYADFEGLWCEVQVQTSLNHAWAEMAHDTIYKRPDLAGFGEREMEAIERRLDEAMRDHLLPAGFIFQRIATDIQRLAEGKSLFDTGIIDMVVDAKDNNSRLESLRRLRDDILPLYDDPISLYPEISSKLEQAWLKSKATETIPHETPFGDYPGAEPDEVAAAIADILNRFRFHDIRETYALVCRLYRQTENEKSKSHLIKLAEQTATPTLQVWERFGAAAQEMIAEALATEADPESVAPLIASLAGEILNPDITGTTSTSDTVTFHTGAITYSEGLAAARRSAIDALARIADADPSRLLLSTMFKAARAPRHHGASQNVMAMIIADAAYTLEIMKPLLLKADPSTRQDMEENLLHIWRRYRSLPNDLQSDSAVTSVQTQLIENALALRDVINADEDFVAFKTIVGFRSVLPQMWEEDQADYQRDAEVRDALQDELLSTVSPESWETWKRRIIVAAEVDSIDGATFPPLVRFISEIAAKHPGLALDLLADRESMPDWTVRPLAIALLKSREQEATTAMLNKWIDEGEYLWEIAQTVCWSESSETDLAGRLTASATDRRDVNVCAMLMEAAVRRFGPDEAFWRDQVFFPCLKVSHAEGSYHWVNRTWFATRGDSLFASLDEGQCDAVLAALVGTPTVDTHTDYIVSALAEQFHLKVLDWLRDRISYGREGGAGKYEAIPFSFSKLHEVLSAFPGDVIAVLLQWRLELTHTAEWDLSHFWSKIFPDFDERFAATLMKFIANAEAAELSNIASSLGGFEGNEALLPVLRAIIASELSTDEMAEDVAVVWNETGVMSGEFGPAQTYQRKADLLRPWLNDASKRVVEFAEAEIRSLERMVAANTRRAQEEVALRRLAYGEPLEE